MDIKLFILLGCFAVFCQNCKKEETLKNDPVYFKSLVDLEPLTFLPDSFLCTATKEVPGLGVISWVANCSAIMKNNKFSIGFITYEDSVDLYVRERLTISNIPALKGLYQSKPLDSSSVFSSYSRWLSDGDVLNASWEINAEKNNYIDITKLDKENRIVGGKFDIHFIMTVQGSFGYLHSEEINFKSGTFTARFVE
jgi:hypothetical protein